MASKPLDGSTEEKIKQAANKLFVEKGFAATKTRDIAQEAGINLALLNYYFRSKEKLFDMIMLEHLINFMQAIGSVINDETTSFEDKLELIVSKYIDMFMEQPNIPSFILGEIRRDPKRLLTKMETVANIGNSVFLGQLMVEVQAGRLKSMHPIHFVANLVGLTVFPFVGKPILQHIGHMGDEQYNSFVLERKKLIPQWLLACFKT